MGDCLVAAGAWPPGDAALAQVAERAEVRLVTAASAGEAASALQQSPAALLVDARFDGAAELVARVRQDRDLDLLPVLVAVERPTDADAVRAYMLGADDFVLASELASQLPPKLAAALSPGELTHSPPAAHAVLLADPSELHRLVLGKLLGQAGFAVTAVADGAAAVAELEKGEQTWELLILDLQLPEVEAVDVLARFREKLRARTPQAIALTHVGVSDATALRALTSGFRCVHDKRRPPEDLVFVANEARADSNKNLRAAPRLLCSTAVRWRISGGPWEMGLSHNLSLRGLYVRVIDPPKMGTMIDLVMMPPGCTYEIEARARVAWRKDFASRAVRSYPTGMGLAIDDMSDRIAVIFEEAARILASGSGPIAVTRTAP